LEPIDLKYKNNLLWYGSQKTKKPIDKRTCELGPPIVLIVQLSFIVISLNYPKVKDKEKVNGIVAYMKLN
jgi:hypothetical protein